MHWKKQLKLNSNEYDYCAIADVVKEYNGNLAALPYSIRVLLESVARHLGEDVTEENIDTLVNWNPATPQGVVPFKPARVVLQDFTGVPAVVDLAAMRDAIVSLGGNASDINPEIPVTLVVDHSVQVDASGRPEAIAINTEREFERNQERYQFLKWAQQSFNDFEVVPPETGIIHQVNIESLSDVVISKDIDGQTLLFPDTLQGTDSHTTMINGLGVLGWGVGGIEAEAAILGEASFFPTPEVIGVEFVGSFPAGTTATDLALAVTERLRKENVVGKFVEYFGTSYSELSLADRATLANMAPEYGATCGFCPIDEETLNYMATTGRSPELIELVEAYAKENHLFYDKEVVPTYTKVITIDLGDIQPSLAGPKRPQDRITLSNVAEDFDQSIQAPVGPKGFGLPAEELEKSAEIKWDKEDNLIHTGDVLLAAITSCTNTSNPFVMLSAGLLAKNAVEKGLKVPAYVKTSLAPGSKIVTSYLTKSGLLPYLEKLGFYLVGYGCTTCIGNSGPLDDAISDAIQDEQLLVSSVLSGNRNFEGRIHPLIKANYLASPPLVVAYALAGTVRKDLTTEPLGIDKNGQPVMLNEIWPSAEEVQECIQKYVSPDAFKEAYSHLFDANERWNEIETTTSDCYEWEEESTYIANPPFFEGLTKELPKQGTLENLHVLAKLADSVTTDHISPAGSIGLDSPAGKYLKEKGVTYRDFNSFGSRRGNHEIMMRGTFGNIRLQNQLVPGSTGSVTRYLPTGEEMSIYDAAMKYQENNIGGIVLAGKDYGMGSSRDWAAKGTQLLGVKAVLAESFERIHRSNLVMMGVVPLEYLNGDTAESLGLTGEETFDIFLPEEPEVKQLIDVIAKKADGTEIRFTTRLRFDAPADIRYWKNQGILPMVIRKKMA
ncbi:aconitate hydratase AcnA [Enterococcus saccharolyticus]|uniref:Aconitate hydratase n=1 Tax=Enterococcus saccharolyticus subsp. saccharolyticus ATCC 43076 TaxID=1139996 RepID=S0JAG3_9ENTE|nr:aconitate hydratase AcnA [Enterococcus saccharolyticus]EOT25585.1 aconitate hydratase 1 [Enterococcus saccharolyticus subsp. saccharolyticus ATCC 43076]EOT83305.1 aconitate hydratase 1 [Enterococcus saccharolyticus subsp. saccharolyticus ATCC 43076]OJG90648.1 aconitate hydratase 1 [Enterococcus saccharolyticus]